MKLHYVVKSGTAVFSHYQFPRTFDVPARGVVGPAHPKPWFTLHLGGAKRCAAV